MKVSISYCDFCAKIDSGQHLVFSFQKNLFFRKYKIYDISIFIDNNSHAESLLKKIIDKKKDVSEHLKFHGKKALKKLKQVHIGNMHFCKCKICDSLKNK